MARILLIDDDVTLSRLLQGELERHGYRVACLERAEGGPDVLATGEFDLVLLDNQLPGMSGTEFLGALQQSGIRLPVILMTGYATASTAIEATKLGAFAYVIKPTDMGELFRELEPLISKALEIDWRGERVRLPGSVASEDDSGSKLLGNSKPMQQVCMLIGKYAKGDIPVLIYGETGTEKELVARAICANSARKEKPFVAINCTALSENELEVELFGHEPGVSRGAEKLRKGGFEHADGGTLFLDDVGDLPLRIQGKLLGILKNQEVYSRGSSEAIKVNVRLLAATHYDLEAAMRAGKFLEDLFFRLNQRPIRLPRLRERGPEDLQLLVKHFLTQMARSTGQPVPSLQEEAWAELRSYSWPGNVSELQNVIGRAALVCRGPQISAADIEFDMGASSEGQITASIRSAILAALHSGQTNLVAHLRGILHQELLLLSLQKSGGDQEKAARLLGVPLGSLLKEETSGPAAEDKDQKPKPISFQAQALVLIANHPKWSAEKLAQELGCSKAKLYRDPIVNRALKGRSAGSYRTPPSGYKSREGDLEAYE